MKKSLVVLASLAFVVLAQIPAHAAHAANGASPLIRVFRGTDTKQPLAISTLDRPVSAARIMSDGEGACFRAESEADLRALLGAMIEVYNADAAIRLVAVEPVTGESIAKPDAAGKPEIATFRLVFERGGEVESWTWNRMPRCVR